MGVGVEPVVTDHDLTHVGDMGRHPDDDLQAVHPFELRAVGTVPVADLAPPLQK
jgi:hypothetical protein